MRIILLGSPGAGKGTQAKQLAKRLNLTHISTGDILRDNVRQKTLLGKEAEDFMNKGLLVPDELVTQMLTERLKKLGIERGFILDGYPRNLEQARRLDEILKQMGGSIDLVVDLDCREPVIIQRLSARLVCGKCFANFHKTNMPPKREGICDNCQGELYQRDDDKVETIKKRLLVYRQQVAGLLRYYQEGKKLRRISADEEAEVVLNKIIDLAGSVKERCSEAVCLGSNSHPTPA